jgi:hypothetical protein
VRSSFFPFFRLSFPVIDLDFRSHLFLFSTSSASLPTFPCLSPISPFPPPLSPPPQRWLQAFIALKGQAVLGNALHNINKPDAHRKPDVGMEAELIKSLRTLFNHTDGARDAIDNNTSISAITASLASEIPTRKSVIELLTFFVARDRTKGFNLVLKGLDDFSSSRRLPGKFDGWFFFWEAAIDGRGRFGSSVGASETVLSLRGTGAREALARGLVNGGGHGERTSKAAADVKDQALADYAVRRFVPSFVLFLPSVRETGTDGRVF